MLEMEVRLHRGTYSIYIKWRWCMNTVWILGRRRKSGGIIHQIGCYLEAYGEEPWVILGGLGRREVEDGRLEGRIFRLLTEDPSTESVFDWLLLEWHLLEVDSSCGIGRYVKKCGLGVWYRDRSLWSRVRWIFCWIGVMHDAMHYDCDAEVWVADEGGVSLICGGE